MGRRWDRLASMTTVKQDAPPDKQPQCIGFSQAYEIRQQKREQREGPQPWVVRKLMVLVVLGILGYTYYVYVVRLCIAMIQRSRDAMGGQSQGSKCLCNHHVPVAK